MDFIPTDICDDITADKIYTIYYFEFMKDYEFLGENHDFWEIIYIDKGCAIIGLDEKNLLLGSGEAVVIAPNVWHTLRADNISAPNVFVISFSLSRDAHGAMQSGIFHTSGDDKNLISKIISEYPQAFESTLTKPTKSLIKRKDALMGAQQLIRLYLNALLISYARQSGSAERIHTPPGSGEMFDKIVKYMSEHLGDKLTLTDMEKFAGLSKSSLIQLFSAYANSGVIEYYIYLKTEEAKKYIRSGSMNISQIAAKLGYDSIHYFSRQFKLRTGMTPTEYQKSVIALSDAAKSMKSEHKKAVETIV